MATSVLLVQNNGLYRSQLVYPLVRTLNVAFSQRNVLFAHTATGEGVLSESTPEYKVERPVPCRVVPIKEDEESILEKASEGLRELITQELVQNEEEVPDLTTLNVKPTHILDLGLLKQTLTD